MIFQRKQEEKKLLLLPPLHLVNRTTTKKEILRKNKSLFIIFLFQLPFAFAYFPWKILLLNSVVCYNDSFAIFFRQIVYHVKINFVIETWFFPLLQSGINKNQTRVLTWKNVKFYQLQSLQEKLCFSQYSSWKICHFVFLIAKTQGMSSDVN